MYIYVYVYVYSDGVLGEEEVGRPLRLVLRGALRMSTFENSVDF